ncbi:carbohydrate-binding protein, partial [Candidatus Symbiothrix dinenymphae]|uniref:carbohydrate-binding protein n=1 Tax=Candidatus Symbiothrix dinenymphae TaxID=467085 RepID=UPI000A8A4278
AWAAPSDWQVYTIDVQDAGIYKLEHNYATNTVINSATCTIDLLDYFGTINSPGTGSYTNYRYVDMGTVYLSAGTHKIKWIITAGDPGIMGIRFTKVG